MKFCLSFFLIILFQLNVFSQGIEFFHGTWEEALEKATEEEKVIFVDAFASWCGPCKRMAKATFPNDKVGDFFNKNFLNVKLDYEKKEAATFRKKYPVSAFPTLYFIDYNGEVVHVQKGAQSVEGIINVGRLVLSKIDRSDTFRSAYEEGDKSAETVYRYVKALNQANKSSLAIVNEYLSKQKDLKTPENLKIIFEGASEADSRVFDLMIRYRKPITKLVGPEAVSKKIKSATVSRTRSNLAVYDEAPRKEYFSQHYGVGKEYLLHSIEFVVVPHSSQMETPSSR